MYPLLICSNLQINRCYLELICFLLLIWLKQGNKWSWRGQHLVKRGNNLLYHDHEFLKKGTKLVKNVDVLVSHRNKLLIYIFFPCMSCVGLLYCVLVDRHWLWSTCISHWFKTIYIYPKQHTLHSSVILSIPWELNPWPSHC